MEKPKKPKTSALEKSELFARSAWSSHAAQNQGVDDVDKVLDLVRRADNFALDAGENSPRLAHPLDILRLTVTPKIQTMPSHKRLKYIQALIASLGIDAAWCVRNKFDPKKLEPKALGAWIRTLSVKTNAIRTSAKIPRKDPQKSKPDTHEKSAVAEPRSDSLGITPEIAEFLRNRPAVGADYGDTVGDTVGEEVAHSDIEVSRRSKL